MRVMAGWIALTPELPAKLLLGRQVWDCAQHADQWGKRLPELRAPAQVSEPPSPEFVRFLDALEGREAWAETIERLTGVYRVLKPHLVAVYAAHLDRVNPVYEPPTRRILERCLADERRHVTDGEAVLDALARAPGGPGADRGLGAGAARPAGRLRRGDREPGVREGRPGEGDRAGAGGPEPRRARRRAGPAGARGPRARGGGHAAGSRRVAAGSPVQGVRARRPRPDRSPPHLQDQVRRGRRRWWSRRDGPPRPAGAGASARRRSPGWRAGPPARPGPRPGPGRSDPVRHACWSPTAARSRSGSSGPAGSSGSVRSRCTRRRTPARPTSGRPTSALPIGPGARARELPLDRARGRGGPGRRGGRRPPGLRIPVGELAVRRGLPEGRPHLRGPASRRPADDGPEDGGAPARRPGGRSGAARVRRPRRERRRRPGRSPTRSAIRSC